MFQAPFRQVGGLELSGRTILAFLWVCVSIYLFCVNPNHELCECTSLRRVDTHRLLKIQKTSFDKTIPCDPPGERVAWDDAVERFLSLTTFCFLPLSRTRLRETWCSANILRRRLFLESVSRLIFVRWILKTCTCGRMYAVSTLPGLGGWPSSWPWTVWTYKSLRRVDTHTEYWKCRSHQVIQATRSTTHKSLTGTSHWSHLV